jgi:hypothetical protein
MSNLCQIKKDMTCGILCRLEPNQNVPKFCRTYSIVLGLAHERFVVLIINA